MKSEIYHHPIQLSDSTNHVINNVPTTAPLSGEDHNINQIGEVIDKSINFSSIDDDDPVIHELQTARQVLSQLWSPSLNTIIEENHYDIKIAADEPVVKITYHVSTKSHTVCCLVKIVAQM